MTELKKQDIDKIIALICMNYERAYAVNSKEELSTLVDFWYESLKEYPKEIVYEATKRSIRSSEFAPKISTILAEIKKMLCANEPSEIELWGKLENVLPIVMTVYKEAEYFGSVYYQDYDRVFSEINGIFKGLPNEIKAYLANYATLIKFAGYWYNNNDEQLSIEKSRFFKMLPALKERVQSQEFLRNLGMIETQKKKMIEG